jgi:hypothetical protein
VAAAVQAARQSGAPSQRPRQRPRVPPPSWSGCSDMAAATRFVWGS